MIPNSFKSERFSEIHSLYKRYITLTCMWSLQHAGSFVSWKIPSVGDVSHAAKPGWNYPCSSLNTPLIYICVRNLELPFSRLLHSDRHHTFFVRLFRLLLPTDVRVQKWSVIVRYHPFSSNWTPRKRSLLSAFMYYRPHLHKPTSSFTVSSDQWSTIVHV